MSIPKIRQFREHETFETYCRFCLEKFEGDSREDVIEQVQKHEQEKCDKNKKRSI